MLWELCSRILCFGSPPGYLLRMDFFARSLESRGRKAALGKHLTDSILEFKLLLVSGRKGVRGFKKPSSLPRRWGTHPQWSSQSPWVFLSIAEDSKSPRSCYMELELGYLYYRFKFLVVMAPIGIIRIESQTMRRFLTEIISFSKLPVVSLLAACSTRPLVPTNSFRHDILRCHDAPIPMAIPLILLALGSLFVGYWAKV
ncbi:hypothetical protein ACH5RR_001210 [Cinchona calisaya]|uniref:Uncharacterized protein n=1 Tax=Cinchona calisaya TaxID=153742 RepID=A0ABD3B3Z0_9GENT